MRSIRLKTLVCLSVIVGFLDARAQRNVNGASTGFDGRPVDKIEWLQPTHMVREGKTRCLPAFTTASYDQDRDYLPYLFINTPCEGAYKMIPQVEVVESAPLAAGEGGCLDKDFLENNYNTSQSFVLYENKIPHTYVKLIPFRINPQSGQIEKLVAYRLTWKPGPAITSPVQKSFSAQFATNSVLASGRWFKIGTTENAVYKIDYAFLQNLGINPSAIDPRNIQIYGNGGEILSEYNGDNHYDDLTENAIYVQGESDGAFNNSDYILFYGQSPHKWELSFGANACTRYMRNKHFYSDTTFYFLTIGNNPGKRLQPQASSTLPPTYTVTGFDDCQAHENDAVNVVKSGRELYGENFENTQQYSFSFNFPTLQSDTVWIKSSVLGRRVDPGTGVPPGAFDILYPGGSYQVFFPVTCSSYDCDVGKEPNGCTGKNFVYTGGGTAINVTVNRTYTDETGWLNYIWVIGRRALTMMGNQMPFQDYRSVGSGVVSQFNLNSGLPNLKVWDVTDAFNVTEQQTNYSAAVHSFVLPTDTLRKFIAFDGNSYKTPSYSAQILNQNLHGVLQADYIIVAHPWFLTQAQQLADLHELKEKYSYVVVTPQQIYNEFSSGAQDITAIRQFARMLYKRATPGTEPKHMLLFGDASYIYKNLNPQTNTNLVPTFETTNSGSFISSKCSDDFYGFLDDTEGLIDCCGNPNGIMDMGVGRLPAVNTGEANQLVNKILSYYERKIPETSCCDGVSANAEDWRNWVCLIADDLNANGLWESTFVTQSESFASMMSANKRYNIDKIYEDSYKAVSVPGGKRYPDVVTAINNRVARGALIIGYSGHGGELGLSHEEIVTVNQIKSWNNINNLPLFFTATCEFSRFDDPDRTSAGEYVLLNPNGGGIGLFTTTRLAFASDGISLGSTFYPASVNKLSSGKYPALGDIIKKTKQAQPNYLHFALLGDPALTLSYPKEDVKTAQVDTHLVVTGVYDTLSALGKYTVKGFIADSGGNKITSFTGTLYPTVYDKPITLQTLDNNNNGPSAILTFSLQKNAIYRGKTKVVNGEFSFTFIVPKDIFYNYGLGKISYYAQADTTDAAGYYSQIMIGGTSNKPVSDLDGPALRLYMNNGQFANGGITNENPYIYAEIVDSSGINTTGNGLGHDIVATLDANTARAYVLNDYYQAEIHPDSVIKNGVNVENRFYQNGKVRYQLNGLSEGTHHLNIKVWDILNNSSTSATDFVVSKAAEMALAHVLNYPNPFTTATQFFVEHNQSCDNLDVQVQVFTITGKIVKTLQQSVRNEGFRTEGIAWDGKDDFGDKLARGVYIYKVTVKNGEGNIANKIEKLVILN